MSDVDAAVDLAAALGDIDTATPLVNSVTNNVTVNDVANITLHWGGLPVMSDDAREVDDMVATADGCLINMGTVDEDGEESMVVAGTAANEGDKPLVVDPVGVGATPTRTRVANRLLDELDVTILNGNHGEITALAGDDADVRGVESVGEYADIAETALSCARTHDTVVVASGETDIVASPEEAYEITAGHPLMAQIVGTGCMLGVTLATFAAGMENATPLDAALAGTVGFGLAGEKAAEEGEYNGPASYKTAFLDTVAGLEAAPDDPAGRIERVLSVT
ncbi:hydroxyethylthiazole kinase [Natronomonas pharaonis DSM 2160]|uniref:Hydroxyethylthiazole kinase n=1 Tax=Natronomonas pharaonis (strain ATCC 35678 / DSM 2160 / CIP 103997 / JCM 8858 / NBRC 14720 / NCIMB 2260 / Gabara) TaxID=348780 RepID=THIM_NATPD|nr:hydroxyethylthiazole kinase [Natronomonas pharaonis]Q3IP35.1 RecName: Full=Hydroxyethylthiazole kinase; AltName: Full=4-methyl-5-beta-hydroxyethylthiazole kinase; Short=TH kinase; Short=Thz kinase [Natronomonas pharaonis DSM 2160]CAI50117.1 hydroxyethylthiazole kinase [Natronomonas pharaonis DSM 2160]